MVLDDRALKCAEINKEIILLRQPVRKARINIVSKLTREAKKLRTKRGDEKQQEKNKRKADKLGREIVALKTVKDDEITKYGILHLEQLQKTAQNPNVPDLTRIIAKVANHKTLTTGVKAFREKFPDYQQYISTEKKKSKTAEKKQNENTSELRPQKESVFPKVMNHKAEDDSDIHDTSKDENEDKDEEEDENGDEDEDEDEEEHEEAEDEDEDADMNDNGSEENDNNADAIESNIKNDDESSDNEDVNNDGSSSDSDDSNTKINKSAKKLIDIKTSKKVRTQKENGSIPKNKTSKTIMPTKSADIKVISKVAAVKRFTEILQEDNADNNVEETKVELCNENIEVEKTVDDFFMSADGKAGHLVTAPLHVPETEDSDRDEPKGRYFSNGAHKKQSTKPATNNKKWESAPNRKGKWNNNERAPPHKKWNVTDRESQNEKWNKPDKISQFKHQGSLLKPNYLAKTDEPAKKKFKQSENVKNASAPEHLHPSWEAKRKQQEVMKQGFQGKKIVFDDD